MIRLKFWRENNQDVYKRQDLVGYVDGIDTFNEYYIKTMNKLENKYNELEKGIIAEDEE